MPICAAPPTACATIPIRRTTFLVDGQTPALYSIIRNPGARQGAAPASRRRAATRSTAATIADAIVAKVQANGGVMTQGGPRRVPVGMGRADFDQLPRLRRLRAAAARPGLRRARDAEHPRGVRAEARRRASPRSGRRIRMYWHLHGRGEEARLLRPAGEERRPEVRQRAGRRSCSRRSTPRRCAAGSIRTSRRSRRVTAAPTAARST